MAISKKSVFWLDFLVFHCMLLMACDSQQLTYMHQIPICNNSREFTYLFFLQVQVDKFYLKAL